MTRNILIALTIMIIALVGLGVSSAADNGTVDDVKINDIDDVVVVNAASDSIDDVDDAVADDAMYVMVDEDIDSTPTEHVDGDNDAVANQTEAIVEYSEDYISNYDLINLYYDTTYKKHNELNIEYIDSLINEIDYMYESGHRCEEIAEYAHMPVNQVQTIVDKYIFKPIGGDKFTYEVYRLYGSASIQEIAYELGVYNEKVLQKVVAIKSGSYGVEYKSLFLCRDMISLSDQLDDFIIGDLHISNH